MEKETIKEFILRWLSTIFSKWWWLYLFERPSWYAQGCLSDYWIIDWILRIKCRWLGHPAGIVYFNPGATEPDNHCKNCGDELG
jgi:hypothetical protein